MEDVTSIKQGSPLSSKLLTFHTCIITHYLIEPLADYQKQPTI